MKKILGAVVCLVLVQAMPSWGQSVIRDGREWLQPVDFTGLSWNDINAVCPGGACSGTLSGIDLTGYTWASTADVSALMASYGTPPPTALEVDSAWAPAFLTDFTPTLVIAAGPRISGYVETLTGGLVDTHFLEDNNPGNNDRYEIGQNALGAAQANRGGWFYRPVSGGGASQIPTMGAYGLLITAIGLVILAAGPLSRRSSRQR